MGDQHEVPTSESESNPYKGIVNGTLMELFNGKNENSYYSFTIKIIKKDYVSTESELNKIMHDMIRAFNGNYCDHTVEKDSIGRLHMHGTFLANKRIRYTKFKRAYTHIFIKKIESYADVKRWTSYIHKTDSPSNPIYTFIDG